MNDNYSNILIERIKKVLGNVPSRDKISIHEPDFSNSNAKKYLDSCINTGWVSTAGAWVTKFEDYISKYTGAEYAVAVVNGTVALRLSLFCLGVKQNDEVLMPPLSFVATANSVSHLGAFPHFVDIEPETLGMCPEALEKRLSEIATLRDGKVYNKKTGRIIRAVLPVHVFGLVAKISKIKKVCDKWNLPIVEDAAEALGSFTKIRSNLTHAGLIGNVGIISFNGNKIVTTGGGGVLITNNKKISDFARHLSNTAKKNHPYEFFHDQIGWNDRLPNLNAALGVSQLEVLDIKLKQKKKLHSIYKNVFSDLEGVEIISKSKNTQSNYWLITLRLNCEKFRDVRDQLLDKAHNCGLLLRPSWKLISELPMYRDSEKGVLKEAEDQSFRLINLPSSPQLLKS